MLNVRPQAPSALLQRLTMIVGARGLGDGTVRRRWMLVPVYDALASVVSIVALCVNRIEWRGRRFRIRGGRLVPIDENTRLLETRYRKRGGPITVIAKPGVGHHPHSLADPTQLSIFIVSHVSP